MSIRNVDVRRRGGDLFDELSAMGESPLKIVPVRFPIAEETYEIVQVVNEPMGMVERYILGAISEFGPCQFADIENLLGLDQSLIGDVVENLIQAGVDVRRDGDRVFAGDSLPDSIHRKMLKKRVKHRRTFVVNPLTGDLLPITYIDNSSRWLAPFVTENEEEGSSNWLRVRLGDRAIGGVRSVVEALSSTDIERREQLGIPEGAIKLCDPTCLDRQLYSAIAFAVVTRNKGVEVYSAVDFSIRLSNEETSGLSYWNLACHDVQPWVFDKPKSSDETAAYFAKNLDGVECRADGEDTLAVSVQLPEKVLRVDSRNGTSDSETMNMLQMDLINGRFWSVNDFSIWRVVAGDLETESRLVVLRAVEKLRELYRNRTQADSFVLVDWWREFQANTSWRFRGADGIQAIELESFLAEAEQVPDTLFLDWLEDVAAAAGRE